MAALSSELSPHNLVLRIRISDLSCISFCYEEHISDYWFTQNPSSYKEWGCAFSWLVDNRRTGSFIRIVDLSDFIIQRLPQDHFLRDYFPRDRNVCLYPWYYLLWFLFFVVVVVVSSFFLWYYTCFNAILPNRPPPTSPTESKRLFYTSGSLLLSRIQGCHYHLSKFHIYALVYCIGVFLSGLLRSV